MAISQYPEIDRTRRLAELRQHGYITAPGEWRGVGAEYVHSIPRGMDPAMVAGKWPRQKDYEKHLDQLENPTNEPPDPVLESDRPPIGSKERMLLREEELYGPKWPGPPKPKPAPKPKQPRSDLGDMLAKAWAPYAKTGTTALTSIDQYLHDNPETLSGMVGPGSAGPVGMVFKRGIPLATQLIEGNLSVIAKRGGLTENPTTWWVKGAAEIDPKYKALQEAGRTGSREEVYSLHPELIERTGGPANGRMEMSLNHDTKIAKLDFVGVSPEWRGSGFGSELLDSAARMAKIKGMKRIELNALPGSVMGSPDKMGSTRPVKDRVTGKDKPLTVWYTEHGYREVHGPKVGGMTPMDLDLTKWPATGKGNLEYEMRNRTSRRLIEGLAPVIPAGVQSGMGVMPDFRLYRLTKDIPGHPKGSTISETTLRELGYTPPGPDVPPTEAKYFVPEEVPRDFVHSDAMVWQRERRMAIDEATPILRQSRAVRTNRDRLERLDAPEDVITQYTETGRFPEAWSQPSEGALREAENLVGPQGTTFGNNAHIWQGARDYYTPRQDTRSPREIYQEGGATDPGDYPRDIPSIPTRTDRGRPDPGESWSDYLSRIRGLQR